MLKKIILFFVFILSFSSFIGVSFGTCELGLSIWWSLEGCLWGSDVVQANDLTVDAWFKDLIVSFVKKISSILAILAVWSIAYWSMVMVVSWWSEEKIKKWRNIIKWALLWFLVLVSAAWIIKIIIYVVYWL